MRVGKSFQQILNWLWLNLAIDNAQLVKVVWHRPLHEFNNGINRFFPKFTLFVGECFKVSLASQPLQNRSKHFIVGPSALHIKLFYDISVQPKRVSKRFAQPNINFIALEIQNLFLNF